MNWHFSYTYIYIYIYYIAIFYCLWNFNEIHWQLVNLLGNWIPCFGLLKRSKNGDMIWCDWLHWLWFPDYLGCLRALGIANVQDCHHICHQWVGHWSKSGQRFGRRESDELPWCMKQHWRTMPNQQTSDTAIFISHQTTALPVVMITNMCRVISVYMFARVPSATSFRVRCAQTLSVFWAKRS